MRQEKGDKFVVIDLDLVIADGEVLRPRDMQHEYFCAVITSLPILIANRLP